MSSTALVGVAFDDLLEAAPDALVIVDREGRIVLVNTHTERLFGYDRGSLTGERVEVLVPSALRGRHAAHRDRYALDPHRRPMGSGLELHGRRRDGTTFPVEISLSPLDAAAGRLVIAAVRDITSRATTERALLDANRELEAFTHSVSHDLRAPIRQIDGFARLLDETLGGTGDPKAAGYLGRIRDGARHMGRLVDDLLHLARIGGQHVHLRPVPLDDVVGEVVAGLKGDLGERLVEWRVAPLPVAACDPGLMKVVFTNLLSNAVKYTRPRAPAVITVGQGSSRGREAFFVRDNGVGFDMHYAGQLFGVFQRLHDAAEFEGAGVGLATVQRIIHKHGGDIWAEAVPDRGATFWFTLGPAAPAE